MSHSLSADWTRFFSTYYIDVDTQAYCNCTLFDSLVDPQTPDIIKPLVRDFLNAEFAKLNSKNTMDVSFEGGGLPWVGDKDHWNFRAADAATQVRVILPVSCGCPSKPTSLILSFFPDCPRDEPRPGLYA